jgi:rare lipoprotein A
MFCKKIFIYIHKLGSFVALSLLVLSLCSCQSNSKSLRNLSKDDKHNTKYKGHFKVGTEYNIKGKDYKPKKYSKYSKVGKASWYGHKDGTHGKKTANGDIYNKEMLTAAHKTLHMPSLVKVKNLENGKAVIVLVNDRGPYAAGREIDVSEKAAALLGFKNKGVAKVKVEYLHSDTKKLLQTFGLASKEGFTSKKPLPNKKCSVNCHVKLVNLKYGYNVGS